MASRRYLAVLQLEILQVPCFCFKRFFNIDLLTMSFTKDEEK